jgi:hypothetical protein
MRDISVIPTNCLASLLLVLAREQAPVAIGTISSPAAAEGCLGASEAAQLIAIGGGGGGGGSQAKTMLLV